MAHGQGCPRGMAPPTRTEALPVSQMRLYKAGWLTRQRQNSLTAGPAAPPAAPWACLHWRGQGGGTLLISLAPTLESLLFWSSMTKMSSSIFLIFPSAVTFSSCSFCLAASSSSSWSSKSFGGHKDGEKEK